MNYEMQYRRAEIRLRSLARGICSAHTQVKLLLDMLSYPTTSDRGIPGFRVCLKTMMIAVNDGRNVSGERVVVCTPDEPGYFIVCPAS